MIRKKGTLHQTWNFEILKDPMSESPLINNIMANGKKGVLVRSRLSKVGILKLMCKNIMGSTCLMILVLDPSPHQEGPRLIDIYMFPMGCKFYLKPGSPDLFPKSVSQAFPQQA